MVEVVAALIWEQGKFLICQRPENKARGLLWEFVGGKVEAGEDKEQALIRECREELGVEIEVGGVFCDVVHKYPDITVHLTVFDSIILKGEPQLLEHNALKFITPSEIPQYDFCPADKEILGKISKTFNGRHGMRLAEGPFDAIKVGSKKIEVRLYDEKRRKINIGDEICFSRVNSFEKLKMTVVALHRFDTFEKLFAAVGEDACGGNAYGMYAYYTLQEEERYGVLGIEMKRASCIKIEHYSWNANSIYRYFDKSELTSKIEKMSDRVTEDPAVQKSMRILIKSVCADSDDMPESPSWDYWAFQDAAVNALSALVKKPTDRRSDVLKRARYRLENAIGRDREIYTRIIYEVKMSDDREFDGLKEYLLK